MLLRITIDHTCSSCKNAIPGLAAYSAALIDIFWELEIFHFSSKMTSSQTMALPQIALPGQPLGPSSSYIPGPGTHLPPSIQANPSPSSIIHASILGPTVTTPTKKGLPTLSISRQETKTQQTQTNLLPKEGSII